MSKPKIETTITRDNSLIDVYAWHKGYTLGMKKWLGWSYSDSVFYIHDGYTEIMRPPQEHMVDFRDQIISKIESDPSWFKKESDNLYLLVSQIFEFYEVSKNKVDNISGKEVVEIYQKYVDYVSSVMGLFITMYWVPVWFEGDEIKKEKYKNELETAIAYRKKTEHLFPGGAELTNKILSRISKETSIDEQLLRVLSAEELINYFDKSIEPDQVVLKERAKGFVYSRKGIILTDNTPEDFVKVIDIVGYEFVPKKHDDVKEIKGQSACKGNVKGRVMVIMSKKDISTLEEGEVLVSAMTTPEYLPAMQKSSAFVTDEGGITCHAAIVARELNKPCIIGTKIATKVLRTGMMVEVDANIGVVKIIK